MENKEPPTQTHPLIKPDHLQRLAVVYVRQSTEEQVRENIWSTEYQKGLVAIPLTYGWSESQIVVIDEDLGKSGSSTEQRAGFKRLQAMIAAKEVGAVFAADLSRLSRSVLAFELFRLAAATYNTLIHTDGRFMDPADSSDTVLSQVTATIVSYENRRRAETMSRARYTKARKGKAVSALPVGWVKIKDKDNNVKYEFDPQARDGIQMTIDTFWQTRSIRRTVKVLVRAGIKIPARHGKGIRFKKPTLDSVKRILTHPAYAGTYIYGKTQCVPGGPVLANGQTKRGRVSKDRWIIIPNHHPAYMTHEEQEEIKAIFSRTHFKQRDRAGRGPALTQGLLVCAVCGERLAVSYHKNKSYSYGCWKALKHAERPCTWFVSYDFDQYVLREVFKVLKAPPIEMLKSALEATKKRQQTRRSWIESERERLRREQRRAEDREEMTHDSFKRVHRDALEKLEKILEEKEQFEEKIASELAAPATNETEEDLEELCRLAGEVPTLWNHPTVTNQERKEILRAVVDHIVVAATKERIDATIYWKSGEPTPFSIWRGIGRYNLIRELYEQKLTIPEIKKHLTAGKTSNGQVLDITEHRIYVILHELGLTPNRFSAEYIELGKKAGELHAKGWSHERIAKYFNEQGFPSASGKAWTWRMVRGLHHALGGKTELLEDIHRAAIAEARERGLNYQQMADEFNQRKIGRWSRWPWTERNVIKRCFDLDQRDRKRAQKISTGTALSRRRRRLKSA